MFLTSLLFSSNSEAIKIIKNSNMLIASIYQVDVIDAILWRHNLLTVFFILYLCLPDVFSPFIECSHSSTSNTRTCDHHNSSVYIETAKLENGQSVCSGRDCNMTSYRSDKNACFDELTKLSIINFINVFVTIESFMCQVEVASPFWDAFVTS